jgi:hypothetical protein
MAKFVDQRKKIKLQRLQGPSHTDVDKAYKITVNSIKKTLIKSTD